MDVDKLDAPRLPAGTKRDSPEPMLILFCSYLNVAW